MSGWNNPDGTPRRPSPWGWFATLPIFGLAALSLYIYFDKQNNELGLPQESELTLVEGVARNVEYSSHRKRFGVVHRATFSIGPYRTSYDEYNANFWLVRHAIQRGQVMKVWMDTREQNTRIYKLSVSGEELLAYEDELKDAQHETEAGKIVGIALILCGLVCVGVNGAMLLRYNSYLAESRSAAAPGNYLRRTSKAS